ncbi:tetratricopeptide repeat protein [Chitinophagaceae bacterium LWZ2-11]
MKKTVSMMLAVVMGVTYLSAQSVADGIKYLNYEFKNKTATDVLKKAYDANSKDARTIYWYGQALLADQDIKGAKALYQGALQSGINDPWIIAGMAHISMIEGGDINSIKQQFEQAITMATETKGKNKGKVNPGILEAIGRANADRDAKTRDIQYAIDKLKLAQTLDLVNPDISIDLGVNYLRLGGEYGGEAVKAFTDATTRDPKNAEAKYRIGRVYESQNNKDLFEQYFNDAITADPNYPPVYYAYYEYYANKDVNKAKGYLDQFIAKADPDSKNDLLLADYLFRAGQYNESLDKIKNLDATVGATAVPRINIVYAYDYDRLGDSLKAKDYVQKFFANAPADDIQPTDYELAVKVLSKFPGNEDAAVGYIKKAIASDTLTADRINYTKMAADLYGKAQNYTEQFNWLNQNAALKAGNLASTDYYYLTDAALKAKSFTEGARIADEYIQKFPDQIYGYRAKVLLAVAEDADTTKGTAIPAIEQYITFLSKDSIKNQKLISSQFYYEASYYSDKAKDYPKALEAINRLLTYYPDDKFGIQVKPILEKASAQGSKSPSGKPSAPGSPKK